MDKDREELSLLQNRTACDVVVQKYDYLVEHVNAVRIFPHLVSSGLVDQDFLQYLNGERTDKDKMMALLREVTKCPKESWFDRFTNALSKVPQYEVIASGLLGEFTQLMSERLTHPPPPADQRKWTPRLRACTRSTSEPSLVVNVTNVNNISGVDGVCTMQKIVDNAQAGHKAALLDLQKANARVLEAEKSRIYAEAEKSALEEKVKLLGKLAEVEMHNQLLMCVCVCVCLCVCVCVYVCVCLCTYSHAADAAVMVHINVYACVNCEHTPPLLQVSRQRRPAFILQCNTKDCIHIASHIIRTVDSTCVYLKQ